MEKDHLEILLEDMRGNFKLVLEKQAELIDEMRYHIRKSEKRRVFEAANFKHWGSL